MVRINIVGDFSVQDLNGMSIGNALQKVLDTGDINLLNYEAPVVSSYSKPIKKSGPSLHQDPESPSFLKKHGFNAFTFANNHIMDYGVEAFLKTRNEFSDCIILGCGLWDEAYQCKIVTIQNVKIGFLALTQYEFGVLGDEQYNSEEYGTAWLCHPCVDELILEAKQKCDYLVLLPHAGLEHFDFPLPELCTLYRHFVSMGADAVIGNHPHVPQPWEKYKNALIVYSLGNFVFDSLKAQNKWWNNGIMVQILVSEEKEITFEIKQIFFDETIRTVDCCHESSFEQHLKSINEVFADKTKYLQIVNRHCLGLEFLYDYLFECSGYIRPNIRKYIKEIFLRFKEKFIHSSSDRYDYTSFINNLRCEPHRWVISRIYELKSTKFYGK